MLRVHFLAAVLCGGCATATCPDGSTMVTGRCILLDASLGADAALGPDSNTDAAETVATPDARQVTCNPVTNEGCSATERCGRDGEGVRCDVDGGTLLGLPCEVVDGADDCVRGTVCLGGTCQAVCRVADGRGCAAGQDCLQSSGYFAALGYTFGVCVESCDPLTQRLTSGATCPSGQACYLLPSGALTCAAAGSLAVGEVASFANDCAPGLATVFDADGIPRCTAFCSPQETSIDSPAAAGGLPPHSCAELAGAGTECLYLWRWAAPEQRARAPLSRFGVCFDRSGHVFDDDGDGTAESVWPSCSVRRADDDDDLGVEPEHHELGCAPY